MNKEDDRVPFEEAVISFQGFLRTQNLHPDLLWLSQDRIKGYKHQFWIFRPEEMGSPNSSKQYYEEARNGEWNLAITALTQFNNYTLAYVERGPGKSRMLNFSINTSSLSNYHIVRSKAWWLLVCLFCRLRGLTPLLKHTDMTPC